MELNVKLQNLRKQRGMTQEELAEALYVSRTAISKWESGRGYPSIDSLKAISKFFSVSIDELLSGEEVLSIAEAEHKHKQAQFRDLMFGLLDCSMFMFFFLPFFAQRSDGLVQAVSLILLSSIQLYLKLAFFAAVTGTMILGIVTLALQNSRCVFWTQNKNRISLLFNAVGAFFFILGQQPYAAAFVLVILMMKVWMLIKQQ